MAVLLFLTGLVFFIRRELFLITFNEELAIVSGVPIRWIKTVFLLSMAIGIVWGIKMVGVILISALLVIPGATAQLLAKRFSWMILISCLISLISTLAGLVLSYHLNLAPGGTIVLFMALVFLLSFLRGRKF